MKRYLTLALASAILISTCSCIGDLTPPSINSDIPVTETAEQIKLTNKMTETELSRVDKHGLTLLDEPEQPTTSVPVADNTEHTVSIEFQTFTIDELRENVEKAKSEMPDEEYQEALKRIQRYLEYGEDIRIPVYVLVDGKLCKDYIPYSEPGYDGGTISYTDYEYNAETGKTTSTTLSFETFDEYIEWLKKQNEKIGKPEDLGERDILRLQLANEALKTGNYEVLPTGSIDIQDMSIHDLPEEVSMDHRDEWEYDRAAVEAIKDSIDEISIYDEEMDTTFTVHVTLPPDYDSAKSYPVFFLTDGIWRFGDHTELRKVMENGEAAPVILVSLWYSYDTSYDNGVPRYYDMSINRKPMLDFITDNLMPYLCENYNIDCADSTLYGHSDCGVFTHYALFNSDKYTNQPFGHYIIGSPALWGLYNYNDGENISNDDIMNDYGYFDRNEKLGKSVFLCAGSQEDPDYADKYNGHDTTLEGVAKLKERLESHGADLTYKLYDSHHYQYIPEMLIEYLKTEYPNK